MGVKTRMGVALLCATALAYGACKKIEPPGPPPPISDAGTTPPGTDSGPVDPPDAGTPGDPTIISQENVLLGTTEWKLTRPANSNEIEGYAHVETASAGEKVPIAVSVKAPHRFTWTVYRMGYYGGAGARELARGGPLDAVTQPACPMSRDTGLVACAWPAAFEVATDATWVRGVYLVKLTRDDGYQSYVPFFLKDGTKPVVLVDIPTGTWQAYNTYGGESLYDDRARIMPSGRAFQVSYDRPYYRDHGAGHLLRDDLSLVTWLEAQGLDVSYAATGELDGAPWLFKSAKVIVMSGHDEYWTSGMRDGADAAVAAGTSLVNLGANQAYWQVRMSSSADGRERRVISCYKENAPAMDPVGPANPQLTTKFRSAPVSRPESRLLGVQFSQRWHQFSFPMVITRPDHWALAGSGLAAGDTIWGANGYEVDSVADGSPANVEVLADSPLLSLQGAFGHGQMVVRQQGDALVFSSGGIDFVHVLSGETAADPRAARIVANVLYRALGEPVPTTLVTFGPAALPAPMGPFAAQVKTVAGTPGMHADQDGGPGQGRLLAPVAVATLPGGGLAVVDINGEIGKLKRVNPDGSLETLRVQPLNGPLGVAADAQGNIYVSDSGNGTIRQVKPDGTEAVIAGEFGTFGMADGPGSHARFNMPAGLAVTPDGGLLVADLGNGQVRRVDLRGPEHRVTTLRAGAVGLYRPSAVAMGPDGTVYVVETGMSRVVALRNGDVQPVAGGEQGFADGAPGEAKLLPYLGIAVLPDGSLAVSDPGNYRVRRITAQGVRTLAGSGRFGQREGKGDETDLVLPAGLAMGPDGWLYVAESGNGAIRAIKP